MVRVWKSGAARTLGVAPSDRKAAQHRFDRGGSFPRQGTNRPITRAPTKREAEKVSKIKGQKTLARGGFLCGLDGT
jgi:hypothetical protein